MISGDFNHNGITIHYLESATYSESILLVARYCFITQHVIEPTRGVNALHLVSSSQNKLFNDLKVLNFCN